MVNKIFTKIIEKLNWLRKLEKSCRSGKTRVVREPDVQAIDRELKKIEKSMKKINEHMKYINY